MIGEDMMKYNFDELDGFCDALTKKYKSRQVCIRMYHKDLTFCIDMYGWKNIIKRIKEKTGQDIKQINLQNQYYREIRKLAAKDGEK